MSSDASTAPLGVLEALVQNMREAVITVGTDGRIVYANPSTAGLFGLEAGSIVGRDLADLVPDEHQGSLDSVLSLPGDTSSIEELTIRTATGRDERHLVTATAVEDDEQGLLRCLVFSEPSAPDAAPSPSGEAAQAARAERQQVAHEVNDTIVQGLVAAEMALDLGRVEFARLLIARTSAHARHWIGELAGSEQLEPGMAVRSGPARGGTDTP